MLLGDAQEKCMRNIVSFDWWKKTKKGKAKCNCDPETKVNGECLWGEECLTEGIIYRIECRCCGQYYLGKTQRGFKKRCMEHYGKVGEFRKKKVMAMARLEAPFSEAASFIISSSRESIANSRVSTRSRTRRLAQQPNTPAAASTPHSGMGYLLSLFSQHLTREATIPSTIYEENLENASASEANSDASSAQPTNLTNNPTYQTTNHPSNQSTGSFQTAMDSQSSQATIDAFQREFGGTDVLNQLEELERTRATILKPMLEKEFASIQCTEITRHMWAHVEDMNFSSNKSMYSWIRSNWNCSIVSKSNIISNMKSATTKNCTLCMQERVKLFYAFNEKNPKHKLMNSRQEMYSKCSCKTRFLRLSAVGPVGADETTR